MLAHHWHLIKKERFAYRIANHGHLDIYVNELPRATNEGKLLNIKTLVLSCKTPYMNPQDGLKVYINKEYSSAAGKLHLIFFELHLLAVRGLAQKLESANRQASSRGSLMTFFKTMFKSKEESTAAFTTSAPSTRRYAEQQPTTDREAEH